MDVRKPLHDIQMPYQKSRHPDTITCPKPLHINYPDATIVYPKPFTDNLTIKTLLKGMNWTIMILDHIMLQYQMVLDHW